MTEWKKKSAMALLAGGGLFGGSEAQAQPINTNLVANPSFEIPGSGPVTSWTGSALATYAYSQGYTSTVVPPGSGLLYLHGPAAAAGSTTQSINLLSAGFTAGFLDSGVNYSLSSFFSTYTDTNDNASITAQFFDAGNVSLGSSSSIGGEVFVNSLGIGNNVNGTAGFNDWGQDATSGALPVGTRSVTIGILHTRLAGTACDSYTDLVNFQISPVPEPGTLMLTAVGGIGLALRRRRNVEPKT